MDRFRSSPALTGALLTSFVLSAAVPAQSWNIPDRGVVFYTRQRSTTGSGAGFAEVEMPPLLCAGELDARRTAVALAPADVRDLGMWLAFDLSIGRRKFTRTVDTITGLRELRIEGSATAPDGAGVQTIKARITSAPGSARGPGPGRRNPAGFSGTLEVERTFDRQRGLVTGFRAVLKGEVQGVPGRGGARGAGGDGPEGARPEGGVLRVRDRWVLDRVEGNREPRFQTRVAEAIRLGAEHVKAQLQNGVGGPRVIGTGVDHGSGTLALCLLTLLKADVPPNDPVVQRGFAELRRRVLKDTYSIGVALMAMEALYAPLGERQSLIEGRIKAPAPRRPTPQDLEVMTGWTRQLLKHYDVRERREYLLRFNYVEGAGRYDNSNTQYALLGLYSAHLCGVPISPTVWFANAQHWLQDQEPAEDTEVRLTTVSHARFDRMRAEIAAREAAAAKRGGQATSAAGGGRRTVAGTKTKAAGWPYIAAGARGAQGRGRRGGAAAGRVRRSTASMTTAGLTGVTICQAVLGQSRKGGELLGKLDKARRAGLAWMLDQFSVRTNRNHGQHYYYYLYGMERACEINQIALLGDRDWYFEGANMLIGNQVTDRPDRAVGGGDAARRGGGGGIGGFRGAGLPQTCMAILFLKQSAPPLPAITQGR